MHDKRVKAQTCEDLMYIGVPYVALCKLYVYAIVVIVNVIFIIYL